MKIAIINDIHLAERCPSPVRKGNYTQDTLDKLEYVAQNNDICIVLGDLFHYFANGTYFFNNIYRFFSSHPGKFRTILGNHDVAHRNNNLDRTSVGTLYYTEAIKVETETFYIDGTLFAVSKCDKDISKIPVDKDNEGILLGHNYYEMSSCPEESLTSEDIKKLNYKYVCLGHDHTPHEDIFVGNSVLFRVGSFTRHDKNLYNKNRQVHYLQYDTETKELEKLEVLCKPDSEVFIEDAFVSNIVKEDITFIKVADVLTRLQRGGEGNISLNKTLEVIETPKRCIEDIKQKHRETSVVYN